MRMDRILVIILLVSCPFAARFTEGAEETWPQFRGVNGDGWAPDADPPVGWSESSNICWKVALPGRGHSSPVTDGKNIWVTTAIEENVKEERIGGDLCFIAERITLKLLSIDFKSGDIKWEKTLFDVDKPAPIHVMNSFSTPTPFYKDGRIYCDFGTFGTACVNAKTGDVIWQKTLSLDHQVGPGSSVFVYKNLMILVRDGRNAQYVTALNIADGAEVWKTNRPPLEGDRTDMMKSFSTPAVVEYAGKTQMVIPGARWIVSYDPDTGKEHWRLKHGMGFSIAPRPCFGHGMVYFFTGFSGRELLAVKLDGEGDVTGSHIAWKVSKWVPDIPSAIVIGDELYWVADAGVLCCADAKTGEIIWHNNFGGRFRSSPIYAGNKLYFLNSMGKTFIIEPGREFKQLAENEIDKSEIFASPVAVGKALFIRTKDHLYRIEQK